MFLYELTERYQQIADLAFEESEDDGRISREFMEIMQSLEGQIEQKLASMCRVVKTLEAVSDACKAEEERIRDKRKRAENHVERIKSYMMNAMEILGVKKIVADELFTVAIQKSPPSLSIIDFDSIPHDYDKQLERQVDSKKIKEAIAGGVVVPGCEIIQGQHVRIR